VRQGLNIARFLLVPVLKPLLLQMSEKAMRCEAGVHEWKGGGVRGRSTSR
jgi:hypothetical protein